MDSKEPQIMLNIIKHRILLIIQINNLLLEKQLNSGVNLQL